MAFFRGVRRIFRSRLFLFFILILLATIFLCGLEVFKYKRRPRMAGEALYDYSVLRAVTDRRNAF